MKNIFKIFLFTDLSVGILNVAEAQRSRLNNTSANRENRGAGLSQPHYDRSSNNRAQVRTFTRSAGDNNRSAAINQERSRSTASSIPQRNEITRSATHRDYGTRGTTEQRNRTIEQRNIASSQSYRRPYSVPRSNNRYNYHNTNSRYQNYYRAGYNRRPVFMYGPRYTVIPRSSISIHFGGNPYYYNNGYFYGYYGGYYQPVFPPFGLHIGILPFGYSRVFIGADPFFYYNGIYYRQFDDNTYEVVDAPMGATVSSLPKGAKAVVVNGEKLYELNGTYYKADRDSKGHDVYTVVGKNGEINNTDENGSDNETISPPPSSSLQVGDMVNQLPEGSKIATINGEKIYITPDDNYLKEESNNGIVQYEVVGK